MQLSCPVTAWLCWAVFAFASSIGQDAAEPLAIGETFTIESKALNEQRRINVYLPAAYAMDAEGRLPVLFMPDGGMGEDFLHIAGLVQVGSGNGTMRPMILVGIENTQRRRDLTGPTEIEADKKIAPVVGGSAAFRSFIRDELIPEIERRYRTTNERGIVGESLAGLFVAETFLIEPALFDHYIAVDPSLWWNDQWLLKNRVPKIENPSESKSLYLACSNEPELKRMLETFSAEIQRQKLSRLDFHCQAFPNELHSTIFHPAALAAFRKVFAPK